VRAYVCVYRHSVPRRRDRKLTEAQASANPRLASFLREYDSPDCFYDWGDDPSFFAASEILGTPNAASWGVCRRDVRATLASGDFVVWFCAKQNPRDKNSWSYFYIGCSTAKYVISRRRLWKDERFATYRSFFNVLGKLEDGKLVQHETFHKFHDDWRRRASAGYVIFDSIPTRTAINIRNPIHVATKNSSSLVETWRLGDSRVRSIRATLLDRLGIDRGLRTKSLQRPHRHIALHRPPGMTTRTPVPTLEAMREELIRLTS
jgi:hypothetical protein